MLQSEKRTAKAVPLVLLTVHLVGVRSNESGASINGDLKSVARMGKLKGDVPLPENEPVSPETVVHLRSKLRRNQVREGLF